MVGEPMPVVLFHPPNINDAAEEQNLDGVTLGVPSPLNGGN
jgi:hypothetical protein